MNETNNIKTPIWLILIATAAMLTFIIEAAQLLAFPGFMFEGPWQGLHIIAAARILEGLTLYPDPNAAASYYVYSPLLPWIHAGFLAILGKSIFAMKVSALVFCLATLAGIYKLSRVVGATPFASITAMSFYLAFYEISQYWHLSIRPDTAGIAFVLWGSICGFLATKETNTNKFYVLTICAGLLFACAALCKQPFGLMGIAFFAYLAAFKHYRVLVVCVITWVAFGAATTLPYIFGDEYFLESMLILRQHETYSLFATLLSNQQIFLILAIPLALAAVHRATTGPLPFLIAGALIMGVIGTIKWGGNINAYLSLFALCAPMMAFQLSRPDPTSRSLTAIACAIFITFFAAGSVNRIMNYSQDRPGNITETVRFIEENADKTIYFPRHNYLTYLYADQYHHCDWMSENLVRAGSKPPNSFLASIAEKQYDYIMGQFSTSGLEEFRDHFYHEDASVKGLGYPVYVRNID